MDPKLVVFDLDGTLTAPKQSLESYMAELLRELLLKKKVALISGSWFPQMEKQFLSHLPSDISFQNLFLFPTSGARFYQHDGVWKEIYAETLTDNELRDISQAFSDTFQEINFEHPPEIFGEQIENRGTQVTFSALGQLAPPHLKEVWDPSHEKKLKIVNHITPKLPHLSVRSAGSTSIDVTRKGIDKAHGMRKITECLQVPIGDIIFIGDALFPGGNDHPIISTGVRTMSVSGPKDTAEIIRKIISGENM